MGNVVSAGQIVAPVVGIGAQRLMSLGVIHVEGMVIFAFCIDGFAQAAAPVDPAHFLVKAHEVVVFCQHVEALALFRGTDQCYTLCHGGIGGALAKDMETGFQTADGKGGMLMETVCQENGIHIHCHVHDIVPFSWMNHIVISEKDYEENGHNILLHEQAHIACCHSWDVLWLSLVEVLQWFNPFIWMLSKEMQDVHEYEADLCVLRKGINAKDYQLLIIQKAAGPSSSAFANGFNHSSLKKRITMMIKEKSNPWARAKYLYLLPVAAICMIACTQSPKSTDKAEPEVKFTKVEVEKEEVTEQTVFQVVEEMPEFPGGMQEMMKWLGMNVKYPTICQENGTQGRVIVQFVVTREGDITDAAVAKGVDPYLDAEALRVIKSMPKWKPGKQRGKEVNVKYTLPVVFRLQ